MSEDYQSRSEKNKNRSPKDNLFKRRKKSGGASDRNNSAFDKIFYILIALLFLLLVAFIFFIMNYNDNNADNVSEDLAQSESRDSIRDLFSDNNEDAENTDAENSDAEQAETSESEEDQENTEEELEEEEDTEETQGDLSIINENPPHEPGHATDYSEGSSDRLEIRELVQTVTGIPSGDYIENWIGNDGPGRVEATVTQASTGQQYIVYLSYGEGAWHVESVNPQ